MGEKLRLLVMRSVTAALQAVVADEPEDQVDDDEEARDGPQRTVQRCNTDTPSQAGADTARIGSSRAQSRREQKARM